MDFAVLAPSVVLTVISAVPAVTPVTRPDEFTVATAGVAEVYVTALLVALAGATVGVNCCVAPTSIDAVAGARVTLDTATVGALTVTVAVAVTPLTVVAVIVALPAFTALTEPCLGVTVAISGLSEVKVTDLSSASSGTTVAVSVSLAPSTRVNADLFNVTPDGATLFLSCKQLL